MSSVVRSILATLLLALCLSAEAEGFWSFLPFMGKRPNLDFNGDGSVRIALITPSEHAGEILSSLWASDLEAIVKEATQLPTRVTLETVDPYRSLMGWWYAAETGAKKEALFALEADLVLLAEHESFVNRYPEFFFEGVRCISSLAKSKGIRTGLVLMSRPGISHRDKQADLTAGILYRVADGCGIEAIPAGYAWRQVLTHNRLPGDFPQKARAGAYLAAATVYSHLTDSEVRGAALERFWATKKIAHALAVSSLEAVRLERTERHYSTPFRGVVRVESRIGQDLKLYMPVSTSEVPLFRNFRFLLNAANIPLFFKSPSDWYEEGLDRMTVPFDLVYGDQQQITQYLDRSLNTAGITPKEIPPPAVCLFTRMPEGISQTGEALNRLESLLMGDYDYARKKGVIYIPYPLAWARACQADKELTSPPGKQSDWLTFMLAHMIYTAGSGRFQLPPEREKPHIANENHPEGFHGRCARIGYETMIQLSNLSTGNNAVLLRTASTRGNPSHPCFANIRLLDRPSAPVTLFCATDRSAEFTLTQKTLLFTPENFDIEQTIRISPTTNAPSLFTTFMVSAQSDDPSIDSKNDRRDLIFNLNPREIGGFSFERESASPSLGYTPSVKPDRRPSDLVSVSVMQHGIFTQELFFSPNAVFAQPVALHPTAEDYRRGSLSVSLLPTSKDPRFNGRNRTFTFALSREGKELPEIDLLSPDLKRPVKGPAFVTARMEARATQGIRQTALYLEKKRLGASSSPHCSAGVEKGPPQSRLTEGRYPIWAEAVTADGVVLSTQPGNLVVVQ